MKDYPEPIVQMDDYRLYANPCHLWNRLYFVTEVKGVQVQVTGRDSTQYSYPYSYDSGLQGKRVVEIGSGFGAFMPDLIESEKGLDRTVIEAADLHLMRSMLHAALDMDLHEEILCRAREFIRRADLILGDPDTYLIRASIDDAIRSYPGLVGRYDLVIDNSGPILYPGTVCQGPDEDAMHGVRSLEERLLSPDGLLVSSRDI